MAPKLAFIDTETTSLRPDRRAWEIGLIVRTPGSQRADDRQRWFIDSIDLDLGNADPMSLQVGRFYERHPHADGAVSGAYREAYVLKKVEQLTRGAHLVGAVPNFDAEVLAARMRANGICPSWHYHLIDVEALAVGYLSGLAAHGHSSLSCAESPNCEAFGESVLVPWKSDDLAAALGVKIREEDRHTALGDAAWARDIYDAVMGTAK